LLPNCPGNSWQFPGPITGRKPAQYSGNLRNKQLTEIIMVPVCRQIATSKIITLLMPKTLYSPRLSDDVVRALYREGQRRQMPMTRLADDLLRQALGQRHQSSAALCLAKGKPAQPPITAAHAA
jgi:hypothetical protein